MFWHPYRPIVALSLFLGPKNTFLHRKTWKERKRLFYNFLRILLLIQNKLLETENLKSKNWLTILTTVSLIHRLQWFQIWNYYKAWSARFVEYSTMHRYSLQPKRTCTTKNLYNFVVCYLARLEKPQFQPPSTTGGRQPPPPAALTTVRRPNSSRGRPRGPNNSRGRPMAPHGYGSTARSTPSLNKI
jgi:hypothetical protein